jgi:putative DNA primase/helicase
MVQSEKEKNTKEKSSADIEKQITDNVTSQQKNKKTTKLPTSNKTVLKALYEDEDGDSYLFIKLLKDRYVYDHISGDWYYWNDHYWRLDKLNHVQSLIKEVIQLYGDQDIYETLAYQAAKKEGETDKYNKHLTNSKNLKKRISSLRTLSRKEKIIKLSRSGLNSLGVTGEDWDKKPMLLACKNGCFDLQTGEFSSGNPLDYMKLFASVKFTGEDAPRDLWEKYLLEVHEDQDIINYLQRLFGYAVTGLNTEHVFPIFWGSKARNGKSTLFEVLKYVLGGLAYKVPSNFVMDTKFKGTGTGPDAVTMGMQGKRLIWFSETNKNERLDVAKLKEFSGGDTVSAKAPYARRQTEFILSSLLASLTNKVPIVPADDPGLWHRIHLIPHHNSFIDNPDPDNKHEFKADKGLLEKLKKQASGILMWLIEGCLLWQEFGLMPPDKIIFATSEYQKSQDIFGHFLKECCMVGEENFKSTLKEIYDKYKLWCNEVGHKAMAKNKVRNDLVERFGEPKKINGSYYFKKIHILDSLDF